MLSAAVLLIQSTALLTTPPIARSQPPAAAALHRRCSTPVAKAAVQSLSSVEALTAALNGAASDEHFCAWSVVEGDEGLGDVLDGGPGASLGEV